MWLPNTQNSAASPGGFSEENTFAYVSLSFLFLRILSYFLTLRLALLFEGEKKNPVRYTLWYLQISILMISVAIDRHSLRYSLCLAPPLSDSLPVCRPDWPRPRRSPHSSASPVPEFCVCMSYQT